MSESMRQSGGATTDGTVAAQGFLEAAFGLSYELSKEKSPRQRSFAFQVVIEHLQMLNFAVLPSMVVWEGTAGGDFGVLMAILSGNVGSRPSLFPLYVALIIAGSLIAMW